MVAHVLEHLPTSEDGLRALGELQQVARYIWVVLPGRDCLDGSIAFEQRLRGVEQGEFWHPLLKAYWGVKDAIEVVITGTEGRV